jgi:hypothetical protein
VEDDSYTVVKSIKGDKTEYYNGDTVTYEFILTNNKTTANLTGGLTIADVFDKNNLPS